MKRKSAFCIAFILGLIVSQNTYSEEVRYAHTDSSRARIVLWRISTQTSDNKTHMIVDSAFRENFYTKAKWTPYIYGRYKRKHGVEVNLNPNTYYLVLALANSFKNDDNERKYILNFSGDDYILLDTPENREFLIGKWENTKVIYDNSTPRPKVKGMDIDM